MHGPNAPSRRRWGRRCTNSLPRGGKIATDDHPRLASTRKNSARTLVALSRMECLELGRQTVEHFESFHRGCRGRLRPCGVSGGSHGRTNVFLLPQTMTALQYACHGRFSDSLVFSHHNQLPMFASRVSLSSPAVRARFFSKICNDVKTALAKAQLKDGATLCVLCTPSRPGCSAAASWLVLPCRVW